ncbi:MAG: cupin domain-containing protein [Nitrospirae bacterium]|nr:cupin domain-containing protein [Nitrospirota bacterium]
MSNIVNWKTLSKIEDGCGGEIYKVVDTDNSELKKVEIAMCIFSPGEIAKLHYHKKMEEIYFILEGEGEIELDGHWYPIKSEHSIPIPVGVTHRIKNTSDNKTLKFLAVNSPEWELSDMIVVEP